MSEKIKANGNIGLTEKQKLQKKKQLEKIFTKFLDVLGYDQENDYNIKETPKRMAKMYIDELFVGNYSDPPNITVFPNSKEYDQMIVSGPISVKSVCSHHLVSFVGTAWVGYVPDKNVIGLSKFSRIVKYFMRRPQIQEELTEQISDYIQELVSPKGLIIAMKCQHMCMTVRGVNEPDSWMFTSSVKGAFAENLSTRQEFFNLINI